MKKNRIFMVPIIIIIILSIIFSVYKYIQAQSVTEKKLQSV